jgi:Uma2 family endonuclease
MSLVLSEIELPVRIKTDTPMSDDEFMRFCAANEPTRFERDANGEIIVMSPTWSETSRWNSYLNYQLAKWAEETNSGISFDSNGGFTLPDNSVRAADASWISWMRWNALSDQQRRGFARVCPQFVIELRSKTDRLPPLQAKMEQWIANGAEVAWLIDPVEKTVAIYRPNEEPEQLNEPTSVQGSGPIAGFELVMSRIWQ